MTYTENLVTLDANDPDAIAEMIWDNGLAQEVVERLEAMLDEMLEED